MFAKYVFYSFFPFLPHSQMQMAALSRNTASVAQDFHNAGGGVKTFTISTSLNEDIIKQMIINHMKTASNDLSLSGTGTEPATKTTIIINNNAGDAKNSITIKTEADEAGAAAATVANESMTMSKNVSPPAHHTSKKRRKSSTYEKENENIYITSVAAQSKVTEPQSNAVNKSKQGLDNYIRATRISTGKSTLKFPSGLEVLALGNVPATVNFPMGTGRQTDAGDTSTIACLTRSEKRRKQAQPRKCVDVETDVPSASDHLSDGHALDNVDVSSSTPVILASSLDSIRDKHLDRMVAKKKSCNICSKSNSCMVMPYHNTKSLMLHKLWRHSQHKYTCKRCGAWFNKLYKCIIHKRLQHNMNIMKQNTK